MRRVEKFGRVASAGFVFEVFIVGLRIYTFLMQGLYSQSKGSLAVPYTFAKEEALTFRTSNGLSVWTRSSTASTSLPSTQSRSVSSTSW